MNIEQTAILGVDPVGIERRACWKHPTAFSSWDEQERIAIERVIDSGRFTQGPEVEDFEIEFAAYHGKRHGIMVNSGSSANLVAVASMFHVKHRPLRAGDKAIVPAIAWATTYAPLVQYGLEPVLVDCDDCWNADPYAITNRADKARLVVACSILGSPAALDTWRTMAGVMDAFMLEDNCESLGARIAGKWCGTFGDLSTFSFFWSHQISAIEGGMILTDDDEMARLCRMLRAHGWARDTQVGPVPFEQEYDFRLMGYNVRGLELHAAIARCQLRKLDGFVNRRRDNAEAFRRACAGLPIEFQGVTGHASPFGFSFRVQDAPTRNRVVTALRAAGIDCRLPTGGSFRLHAYGAPYRDQETPKADELHTTGLFLGNGPFDMTAEIEAAAAVLRSTLA